MDNRKLLSLAAILVMVMSVSVMGVPGMYAEVTEGDDSVPSDPDVSADGNDSEDEDDSEDESDTGSEGNEQDDEDESEEDKDSDEGNDSEEEEDGSDDEGEDDSDEGEDDDSEDEDDEDEDDEDEDDEDEDEFDIDDLENVEIRTETITNDDGTVTEVRYADGIDEDGNTVHIEKRVTVFDNGNKMIVEIEQVTDSKGNVEEEKSVKLKTPAGEFETEVETYTDANGKVTTDIETEIETEDDVPLSADKIRDMIAQSNSIMENMPEVGDEIRNFVKVLAGADSSVEIAPEAFQQLVENGTEFQISTNEGIIAFDSDVCQNMSGMATEVKVTMKQNDKTGLTQEQIDAVGDNPFITLNAESADGKIHQLNGNADITLSDASLAGKKVVYVDDQGNTEVMESKMVGQQLSFTTNHFSLFMVVDDTESESSSGSLPLVVIGAAVVLAIVAFAVVLVRKH